MSAEGRGLSSRRTQKVVKDDGDWINDPGASTIDEYTMRRLRRWLCAKHKVRNTVKYQFTQDYLREQLGLVALYRRTHDLPWANA
jgi:hypothetical protein